MNQHQLAALLAAAAGTGMAIGGVYVLAGAGWALVAGSLPCFGLSAAILRGLHHG